MYKKKVYFGLINKINLEHFTMNIYCNINIYCSIIIGLMIFLPVFLIIILLELINFN
jgi:hypothetical protein